MSRQFKAVDGAIKCDEIGGVNVRIADWIGEATEYDKKETLEERKPKSWLKSVSVFANGSGGTLIFGVNDQEELIGLTDTKNVSEKISEIIKTKMDPIPQVIMDIHEEAGKEFVILKVSAGMETPYYYIGEGSRTAYVRVGNQSIPAGTMDLKRLVLHGSNMTFDSLVSQYRFMDYSFTKLRSVYRKRTGQDIEESEFLSFALMDEKGMLTNAGALLADDSPVKHSRLFCTRWYGIDKASGVMDAIDDKELSGSLITLLQSGEEFVLNNSKKRWKKTTNGRIEMPDYPERAVLECVVNALIHRDYLDLGSEVHIDMFDDRLEIYSPGGMYDGSLVQNLDTDRIPSRRRNPIIADMFNRLSYMERRGSGFKKIKSDYRKEVNYDEKLEPSFYSDYTSFWVTLYNLNYKVSINESNDKLAFDNSKLDFEDNKLAFGDNKLAFDVCLENIQVKQPTKEKIVKTYLVFGKDTVFGRKEVAEELNLSLTGAGDLVAKMYEAGLLVRVEGFGKGQYKFK